MKNGLSKPPVYRIELKSIEDRSIWQIYIPLKLFKCSLFV